MKPFRLQLNVSIFTEPSDGIAAPNHALEKFFRTHLVHETRRIFAGLATNHPNLVSDFEFSFWHAREVNFRIR
jgi:hypothetical protein